MKSKRSILLYGLVLVLCVGGFLALWLPNRTPPDTDPSAPFEDLSDREKEKVLDAIAEYWAYPIPYFWHGEQMPNQMTPLTDDNYEYGVRYYGTFEGYHIVLLPYHVVALSTEHLQQTIAGYRFTYSDGFRLLAYKNGRVVPLRDAYGNGLISDGQMEQIYQCYIQYNEEIYRRDKWEEREEWEEYEKKKEIVLVVYVCCAGVVLVFAGVCTFCHCRKCRTENIQQCDDGE